MNDPRRARPYLLDDVLNGGPATGGRPARLRVGTMVVVTAVSLLATAGISALAGRQSPPARPVANLKTPATPAAAPALTFANQLVVGPGTASGFVEGGQWSGAGAGAPAFRGPDRWVAAGTPAGASASAQWSLGSPTGGQRWDQVRVQAWIPNMHALAWVRYTVTSTDGTAQNVRTFDVSQQKLTGWYTLPADFRIGTPTQRTGTITVRMSYLRPYAGDANGCQMAAAQVQFEWS